MLFLSSIRLYLLILRVNTLLPVVNFEVLSSFAISQVILFLSIVLSFSLYPHLLFGHPGLQRSKMPVTFRLAKKRVKPVRRFVPATDGEDLLRNSTWRYSTARHCGVVLQSSFGSNFKGFHKDGLDLGKHAVYPVSHGNGFVDTAIIAYNEHHHLVIRPDDVWMSILSQFCLYVNANAEALRHLFVQDEGKKVLTIDMRGAGAAKKVDEKSPSLQIDFGVVAKGLTDLFQNYISDTDFRDWFLPSFSTTTETDRVVASSIMMATFKEYLAPEACILCGIPAVTLLGDRDDWEKIRTKARDLLKYDKGGQMANWYRLLNPVLERFVRTFDTEEEGHYSRKDRDYFWQRIANVHVGGSGPTWLSGWITAFCFFDSEGKMMYSEPNAGHNEVRRWAMTFIRESS